MNTRTWVRAAISAFIFAVFALHALGHLRLAVLDGLEDMAYDARVRWAMPGGVDGRVVIVDLDERSLAAEGRWPWPRDKVARLVEALVDREHARVVGFDLNFPEPDDRRALEALDAMRAQGLADDARFNRAAAAVAATLDTDGRLASAIAGRPVVLGFVFQPERSAGAGQRLGALPPPLFPVAGDAAAFRFVTAAGYTGNLAALQAATPHAGFFDNPLVDPDGAFRRVPLLQRFGDGVHPSLALETLRVALGSPQVEFGVAEGAADNVGLEWIGVGDVRIPVDGELAARVPYRGEQGSFPYVSATDVLHGTVGSEVLRDAIVLVGTTAPGLLDLRNTPVGEGYAGVEVHANLIAGALDGRVLQAPAWNAGALVLLLAALALLMTWVQVRFEAGPGTAIASVVVALLLAGNLAAWRAGLVLPLASPLAFAIVLFFIQALHGFLVESRGARRIAAQFGQYVPPELVAEMADRGERYTFEGQTREMTVLFSDVRDFTAISEGLGPQALSDMMNAYLTPMTRAIHGERGTIDKYIGDAIMAFWGAPLADPAHAARAVAAALAMERAAATLSAEFKARGWPAIRIGVGLATGAMRVGDMGSSFRRQYTVMGDTVNLGSRLEGLTKEYGVTVIASDATRAAAPGFLWLELDRVRVKGREQAVAIHLPLAVAEGADKDLRALARGHAAALELYRAQRWDDAERAFFELEQAHGRAFLRVFLDRIGRFRREPPPAAWDGAFTHASK